MTVDAATNQVLRNAAIFAVSRVVGEIHCPTCSGVCVQDAEAFRDHCAKVVDAVLPVVTQETAQALSLLRSRVEALADEIDKKVRGEGIKGPISWGYRSGLRDAAQLLRSLSDNKEQQ